MPKIRPEDRELQTGLLDDFDGKIVGARFGIKEDYARVSGLSDPQLLLTIEAAELDQPIEQAFSIGSARGWEVTRGGSEVVSRVKPNVHGWIANSRAGDLVAAMATCIGNGDLKKGQDILFQRDRYMTEAEFYIGHTFHWKRQKRMSVDGVERDVLLPVAYLGEDTSSAVPAEVPAYPDALKALAVGKTETELKKAILQHPELKKDAALKTEVYNKGLLARLEEAGELVKDPATGKYL